MEQRSIEPVNTKLLRQIIATYFSDSELRDLCFDLDVDYENLPGQGKGDKARELVAHVGRHKRTAELVKEARRLRPTADWLNVEQTIPPEPLTSALSLIPLTHRPLLNHTLIGRDADLEWLRAGKNDKLLIGQPGSGKTFLLCRLARDNGGLFVVDRDRGAIAAAIRAQQPNTLIVDDAHTQMDLLTTLRQMRTELGAEFSILASCWPGERGAIAERLNLSSSNMRKLEPLDRDQIVAVVNETGIGGPDNLVREIVDQAEGRPGLAVTLSSLCLQGGVRDVALGDALSRSLLHFFEPIIGSKSKIVLAAFSVGGQSGISVDAVASATGMNRVDLGDFVSKLGAGGVVFQTRTQCLSVRPPALRHALVRDVIFGGGSAVPLESLVACAESQEDVVLELIAARARGARVSDALLIPMLESRGSSRAWEAYTGLGARETRLVLSEHPEFATAVAHPALYHVPEAEIPLLLHAAVDDKRALHATPEHPLRLIQDWVQAGHPGTGEAIRRRQALWKAVQVWFRQGRDSRVGFSALRAVVSPRFMSQSLDPGKGTKATISFGGLAETDITEVQTLWPTIWGVIERLDTIEWKELCDTVEDWAYPGRINAQFSDAVHLMMKSFAGQILRDIFRLALGHSGLLHWVESVAQHLALELQVPLEPTFEILYPQSRLGDRRNAAERQADAVRELARSWAHDPPNDVVSAIVKVENEARLAGINWPRWTPLFCEEIARTAFNPHAWARALMENQVSPDLLEPFLRASAAKNEPEWSGLAKACLLDPRFRPAAITVLLTIIDPPTELLSIALHDLDGYSQIVEILCEQARVPPGTLRLLLEHEDSTVAGRAALGAWHARDKIAIDDSLRGAWRNAILRTTDDDYWLAQLFGDEPELAHDWFQTRVADGFQHSHRHGSALKAAIAALDFEQRSGYLAQLPTKFGFEEIVLQLVGDNLELYRQLLEMQHLRRFHLTPLAGHPEGAWIAKARLALEAGHSPDEIALAAVWANPEGFSIGGSEAAVWSEWLERFERLCEHHESDVRAIGEAGKAQVSALRDRALEQERKEAIYGID